MLHHDRFVEMDVIWFDPEQNLETQIELVLLRLAPLWHSTDGVRGLCFNVSWLIDLVTEWTGNSDQKLPLRSRRATAWATRSYGDLRDLFVRIRQRAAQYGLADLRLGLIFVGWGHVVWPPDLKIYDFDSDWYDRHPELYGGPNTIIGMPDLWPINRLAADQYPYATQPHGLANGTYFPEFFGAQWGNLSRFLGIDVLHLRDGMTGPMVYTRMGPYGANLPADTSVWQAWTQTVIELYRAIKAGNASTFLMGYSSAISPTAEWRVGGIDLEALVADGAIDAWVDQTWGGAWQDWWHQLWKGWTFQLANLLTHRVQIEAGNARRTTPCRHYNLIETWDGWEPWDTLHQVPDKLRWGIWAFNHAAAVSPDGPRTTDGSYISWANQRGGKLLSDDDVKYLSIHLDAAQESASRLTHIRGPLLVYNRPALDWLMHNHPDWNASEWIEDQVGLLMKWGVPCLAATRIEWLPEVIQEADGLILQVPGRLDDTIRDLLLRTDLPAILIGRADLIDPALLARCGATLANRLQPGGFYHLDEHHEIAHLPTFQPITASSICGLNTELGPLLATRDRRFIYWQPPDWSEPGNAQMPKYQLGSTLPHVIVADLFNAALDIGPNVEDSASAHWTNPLVCHVWQSDDKLYMLVGNLETGVFGDSRTARTTTIRVGPLVAHDLTSHIVLRRIDASDQPVIAPVKDAQPGSFDIGVSPESCAVYRVEAV